MYDSRHLQKLKVMRQAAPEAYAAYEAFTSAALKDGAIPAKYKELMALAVAMTTQCPYCIDYHKKQARQLGCSDAEISEAVLVAAALRAGAAVTHGAHALLE
ncbi:MAG: carboxymuconolactone decarboxylase family protein [Gemmataceae bacterium]|nr:carboxymuconolactone decarboxylase family protein [Gemmataceae bacterium]MCS7269591.1 carboxymuconolactone decarboxylase family protein [Gemmataceae bacterium]MDW8244386.1 carboxymuconolactone decarboxylase family protein [Thermogemmata sp.]